MTLRNMSLAALFLAAAPEVGRAQIEFPAGARAAMHIAPQRLASQPTADRVFGLTYIVRLYEAPDVLGGRAARFTLYTVPAVNGWTRMGVTAGSVDLAQDFERLRGKRTGSAGGHALYTYRNGARGRVALVGRREIAEGTKDALLLALDSPHTSAVETRQELERSLRGARDSGAVVSLVYVAPPDGANLVQMVDDLGAIWGPHLAKSIEPYESALSLLGSMRAARADVAQHDADLDVRLVFVAADGGAAKRSHLALRTARGLAPMISRAAVSAGSMSQADADAVASVLGSMQSRVDDDRIYVELRVPGSVVQ